MELSIRYGADLIDGREDVDVDIVATVSGKYIPAKVNADPDDCYDAENPEVDLDAVILSDTKEDVTALLTPDSKKAVMAAIWKEVWDWEDCVCNDYDDDNCYDEDIDYGPDDCVDDF